jgi:tRNA(adenine34) deaminase
MARHSFDIGEVPVGCVIVKDNQLLAKCHNEVEARKDVRAHAEMLALEEACKALDSKYLQGCTLYVTLEPCPMCTTALMWSKIDTIVFGAMDSKAGACGTQFNLAQHATLNHHIAIIQGIRDQECESLLKLFFSNKRTKPSIPLP